MTNTIVPLLLSLFMIIGTLVLLELMYKTCTGWFLTDEQVLRSSSSARLGDTTSVSIYIEMSEPCWCMIIRHLTVILWFRHIPLIRVYSNKKRSLWIYEPFLKQKQIFCMRVLVEFQEGLEHLKSFKVKRSHS